jgi:hypothetical protein
MDDAGDVPLSRSGFADDQDRCNRNGSQTNLIEQPAMGRAQTEETIKAGVFLKLASDLQKLDVQPVCLCVGHAGLFLRCAHDAKQPDQALELIMEGPELQPPPDAFASGPDNQHLSAAWMAGK